MNLFDYEKEHLSRVRAGLGECMVLLKSNGAFPLEEPCALAAYGSGVRHSVKGGTGSGDVNAHFTVGVEEGLLEAGFRITSGEWLDKYDAKRKEAQKAFFQGLRAEAKKRRISPVWLALGAVMPEPEYDFPLTGRGEAAIYVLTRVSGEGRDREPVPGDVLLTESERRDILALNERYQRFLLVLNTGGVVDLSPVKEVGNILLLSQLGAEMGRALADVLLGRTYPSGKLTTTWSAWSDYCGDIDVGADDETRYREGVYVGYRWFDTVGRRALFPFGYGLGYTQFFVTNLKPSVRGRKVSLSAAVRNVGRRPGKEVLQLYVTAPERALRKPFQSLAAFAKTRELSPGEMETLSLSFDLADLASFDEAGQRMLLEAGDYVLRLGTSSADTVPAAVLHLDADAVTERLRAIVPKAELKERVYERAERREDLSVLPRFEIAASDFETRTPVYDAPGAVDELIAALSDEELCRLAVGQFPDKPTLLSVIGQHSAAVAGAAGESTRRLADHGIEPIVMADGPAGLRLAREYYRDEKGVHPVGDVIPDTVYQALGSAAGFLARRLTGARPPRKAYLHKQYCTSLPVGTALAQSWNTEYARRCGDVVGAEMERFGVRLWLAPAMNIHRSILCGRNFEYYSEDPLLSGKMAAAVTQGVQAHPGKGVTIKHFAANNQETNRYFNNSRVSERALREIYLRGFAICIREAVPAAVMTSYNLINGVHTSELRGLSEDYLRAECGHAGLIMTDWVMPMENLGSPYRQASADHVAAAGGDLFMPGRREDYDAVLAALKAGWLPRRQLEEIGTRVLRMSRKLK